MKIKGIFAFRSSHLRSFEDASRHFIDILALQLLRINHTNESQLLDESVEIRLLSVSRLMRVSTNALEDARDERMTSSKEIKEKMAPDRGSRERWSSMHVECDVYPPICDGTLPRYTSHEYGDSRASRERGALEGEATFRF